MTTLQYISSPKLQDFHYTPKALDGPGSESWLEEIFFSPSKGAEPFWCPTSEYRGLFLGVIRPKRDIDPTPPCNAGLRMNGVILLLTLRLQGVVKDNFTFLYNQMFLTAVSIIFFIWRCSLTRPMASSFTKFSRSHTRRATVGRTPPDE
jgi:hypothetical protein